jgi:hypothetical protein
MKKIFLSLSSLILLTPVLSAAVLLINTLDASAATYPYNPAYLISDKVFADTGSMSPNDIQNFLNAENSGIKNLTAVEACDPVTPLSPDPYAAGYYPHCGATLSAANLIYDAAQSYGVSPRVVLATMQKEEGLVTDPSPVASQINTAMGYGCPSSCNPAYQGFFTQIDWGTYQLRKNVESINGRPFMSTTASYACGSGHDVNPNNNTYSTGLYPGRTVTFYNQGGLAQTITIANAPTASLYCYTPFVGPISLTGYSGSYNFVQAFEQWWGSVSSPCYNDTNIDTAGSGAHIVRRNTDGKATADNLALVLLNNTGSACVEAHTWAGSSLKSWYQNTGTNMPAVNPADNEVISADIDGSGRDELILVKLRNTASGRIEIHTWDTTNQHWYSNVATNYPAVDPAQYRVISADLNGDGKDELILVKYLGGSSGRVEIFPWSSNYQSFTAYIATNLASVSPDSYDIVGANTATDGGKNDKLVLVKYQGDSGRIELHTWNPGEQNWYSNVATNYPAVSRPYYQVVSADLSGRGKDQLILAHYNFIGGTASGKVEVFPWNPGYQSFSNFIATNISLLNTAP